MIENSIYSAQVLSVYFQSPLSQIFILYRLDDVFLLKEYSND